MAKKVGFGKLEREMLSNDRLPMDVRMAIVDFKNSIKSGANLAPFENGEGGLPATAAGQQYCEYQVGQAHVGDKRPAGKRRLVALLDGARNIQRLFFTDSHYTVGAWKQLQYP